MHHTHPRPQSSNNPSPPHSAVARLKTHQNTQLTRTASTHIPIPPKHEDANIYPERSLRHQRSRQVVHEWLTQQQTDGPAITQDGMPTELRGHSSPSPPLQYLAYPELSVRPRVEDDLDTLHSYLIVDDLDIPEERYDGGGNNDVDNDEILPIQSPPSTRSSTPLRPLRSHLRSSTDMRGAHAPLPSRGSPSPSRPTSPDQSDASMSTPRSSSRLSALRRMSPTRSFGVPRHGRVSSISTLNLPGMEASATQASVPASQNARRWRPSVISHFNHPTARGSPHVDLSSSTLAVDMPPSLSRPSMSSSQTHDTILTPTSTLYDSPEANAANREYSKPRKSFMSSIRVRAKSSSSLFLGLTSGSSSEAHTNQFEDLSLDEPPTRHHRARSPPLHAVKAKHHSRADVSQPQVAYSTPSSFLSFTNPVRERKKRKLVIGGIHPQDTRRFEAAKRWCESFGEVSQITRMPNNDLHVTFRKAEVAETVCRVRATVNIVGVGRIQLSWYTGNSRI